MHILLAVVLFIIACFGFVLLYGAPYLPTRRAQQEAALDLLDLPKGAVLYELGCGDGRMLACAAQRGLRVVGYELNPLLAAWAWVATRRYRSLVTVHWKNFWTADIRAADGIYVFLLDSYMERLDKKITTDTTKHVILASYAFKIPGKKPVKQSGGIFVYRYH